MKDNAISLGYPTKIASFKDSEPVAQNFSPVILTINQNFRQQVERLQGGFCGDKEVNETKIKGIDREKEEL